jgi:hypothetical protein
MTRIVMDRNGGRLMYLNARLVLIREYWGYLDDDYRREQFDMIQAEFANIITPAAFPDSWRALAEINGIIVLPAGKIIAIRRWLRKAWRRILRR